MSVGGKVVEVVPVDEHKAWVNTNDAKPGLPANLCAVYVDPEGHAIKVGDSLWWQSGVAYWTPSYDRTWGAAQSPSVGEAQALPSASTADERKPVTDASPLPSPPQEGPR